MLQIFSGGLVLPPWWYILKQSYCGKVEKIQQNFRLDPVFQEAKTELSVNDSLYINSFWYIKYTS